MKIHVGKWGRSLGLRFPKHLVERFNLKDGDVIEDSVLEQVLEQSLEERRRQAFEDIEKRRFRLPPGYKFDREEANAR